MGDARVAPLDGTCPACPACSRASDRCADFWRTQRHCLDAEQLAIIHDHARVLRETRCFKAAAFDGAIRLEELADARLRREPTCRRSPA